MTDLPVTSVSASLDPEDGFRTVLILNERNPVTGGPLTPPIDAASAVIVTTSGRVRRSLNFEGDEPNWDNAAPAEDTGEVYKVYRDAHDPNIWSRAWLAAEKGVWVCEYVFATPIVWTQVLTQAQFLAATGEALHAVRDIETARDRSGYTYCQAQGVSGMIYVGRYANPWTFTALEVTTKTLPAGFKVRPDYHKLVLCAAGNSGAVYRSLDCAETFKLWYTLPNAVGPVRSIEIPLDDWGVAGDIYVSGAAGNAGQMFFCSWNGPEFYQSQTGGASWFPTTTFFKDEDPWTIYGLVAIWEAKDGSMSVFTGWGHSTERYYRTVNRGQEWEYVGACTHSASWRFPAHCTTPTGRLLLICAGHNMYKNDHNGKSSDWDWWGNDPWKEFPNDGVTDPAEFYQVKHPILVNRRGELLVAIYAHDTDLSGVWKSIDDGETWTQTSLRVNVDPHASDGVASLCMTNAGFLVAITEMGIVYKSYNHGDTWTRIADSMFVDEFDEPRYISTSYNGVNSAVVLNNDNILVGHQTCKNGVWNDEEPHYILSRSTDGGHTWEPVLACELSGDWVSNIYTIGLNKTRTKITAAGSVRTSLGETQYTSVFYNYISGGKDYWSFIDDLDENRSPAEWAAENYAMMLTKVQGPKIIKNPNGAWEEDVTPTITLGGGESYQLAAFSYRSMAGSRQDSQTLKILASLGDYDQSSIFTTATSGSSWQNVKNMLEVVAHAKQTALMLHPADDDRMYLLSYGNAGAPIDMIQYSENGGGDWQSKVGDWADDWDLQVPYLGSIEVFFP